MTQREELIKELKMRGFRTGCIKALSSENGMTMFNAAIADFIIAREKALLAEIEKPLKDILVKYKAIDDGRIYKIFSREFGLMDEAVGKALAIIAKHGGQRDGD
jgi:hypothetical protein